MTDTAGEAPAATAAAPRQATDFRSLELRANAPLGTLPRPFLRWAGSKQRLLPDLIESVPDGFGTYFEPFLGAGAMYFLLRPDRAVLADACSPLIETYCEVASNPEGLADALAKMPILDKAFYYSTRAVIPDLPLARAARFLYLNRAGWNGLYRVNSAGLFNVPYGRPKSGSVLPREVIVAAAEALNQSGAKPNVADFEVTVASAQSGDFVYFDPPYVTGHNDNGFIDYNESLFSWADQERLAALARSLADEGVHVVVSNAYHEQILKLYAGFRIRKVLRRSTLAGNIGSRGPVAEAVISL